MSWVDLIYSDNPRKRDKLVRLCSKLFTLLESNFKRTNELIDCINKHFTGKSFSRVRIDMDESLKKNCEVLIKRLEEINNYMETRVRDLRDKLDKETFYDLTSPDKSFQQKLKIAQKITQLGLGWSGGVITMAVTTWIRGGTFLVSLTARLGTLATCALAYVGIGVLVAAVDILISVIIGEIEKRKLNEALKCVEATLDRFEPASDEFNRSVERAIIRIEDY